MIFFCNVTPLIIYLMMRHLNTVLVFFLILHDFKEHLCIVKRKILNLLILSQMFKVKFNFAQINI